VVTSINSQETLANAKLAKNLVCMHLNIYVAPFMQKKKKTFEYVKEELRSLVFQVYMLYLLIAQVY